MLDQAVKNPRVLERRDVGQTECVEDDENIGRDTLKAGYEDKNLLSDGTNASDANPKVHDSSEGEESQKIIPSPHITLKDAGEEKTKNLNATPGIRGVDGVLKNLQTGNQSQEHRSQPHCNASA